MATDKRIRDKTLPSMVPEALLLVEQVGPGASQIDDLWTSIPVLLESCAFEAVKCIRNSLATANNAFVLVVSE